MIAASSPEPDLSLIVLSFRRFADTTRPCMASLLAQWRPGPMELLLVENGSDDGAAADCAALAAAHAGIRHVPLAKNLGFGGGMNAGVAAALGRWVVLVNSDTLFPNGALAALAASLKRVDGDVAHADVALVGPVTNSAGNGQCLPLPGASLAQATAVGAAVMRSPTAMLTPTYRSDFFCVAVRRSVWVELDGLDPAFGMGYYEDFDFSLRAHAAGYRQVIAEDVFVVHAGSLVFSTMKAQQRELLERNRTLMRSRHPQAHFAHVREDNVTALAFLLDTASKSGWTPALRERAAWRHAALLANEPRGPWKRWRWHRAQRGLRQALADAGIAPSFPTF